MLAFWLVSATGVAMLWGGIEFVAVMCDYGGECE